MLPKVLFITGMDAPAGRLAPALRRARFGVLTASSPGRGLEAADRAGPALVVLDGEMPGCSALCSRLRQFTPIPLVVMGAAPEEEGWDRAVEAGADCYLPWATKPVEAVAFFQAMLRRSESGVQSGESRVGTPDSRPQTLDSPGVRNEA